MSKRILWEMPDGSVASDDCIESMTDEEVLAWKDQLLRKGFVGKFIRLAERDELKKDELRSAWVIQNQNPVVSMPKAREVWRNRIRVFREPILKALDVEYSKALERGDTERQQEIAAQKDVLRDLPADSRIESAVTPEELKAFWPTELGG